MLCVFVARNKNKLWGKHITGNPPPCALFNEQDLAVLRILGDTPAFRGTRRRAFDTPIVMAAPSNRKQAVVAIQCNAGVESGPSNITASLNTGSYLTCKNFGYIDIYQVCSVILH